MSAYIVFIKEREHDAGAMATYSAEAGPTLKGRNGKVLAYYGDTVTLEGPEAQGCVIVEFPTVEEARAWYESDAYQAARAHRFAGADYRAIITQGL